MEILLLSGGTPCANFKDLAHAWGREKGFHNLLVSSICERRGEVDRKKRSDARTPEERKAANDRRKRAKTSVAAVATAAAVTDSSMALTGQAVAMNTVDEIPPNVAMGEISGRVETTPDPAELKEASVDEMVGNPEDATAAAVQAAVDSVHDSMQQDVPDEEMKESADNRVIVDENPTVSV